MHVNTARFRFYAELNDFLPEVERQVWFDYRFSGSPALRDAVEALGVPHPEVDLIVVNGQSVGWEHALASGDEVSVYPVFESLDIAPVVRLRPEPLRVTRFVVDAHLGRLARWLRMLGFDALYDARFDRARIIAAAIREPRIILTRDRRLLRDGRVTHGYWVRNSNARRQIAEVVERLDLRAQFTPFARCMRCNGTLVPRPPAEVAGQVPPRARERAKEFRQCDACGKIYWSGTHVERMRRLIGELS